MEQLKAPLVTVDGQDVFTAHFTFEQMQAQGCRIDMVKSIAIVSALTSAISIALNIWLLCG